mmetsp:Transcript_22667/g.62579  ORF Transcript_22667/g.62579 Transcript_22667/m.62579 type:complete len:206 (-) Transcript_22667:589-1206(-)
MVDCQCSSDTGSAWPACNCEMEAPNLRTSDTNTEPSEAPAAMYSSLSHSASDVSGAGSLACCTAVPNRRSSASRLRSAPQLKTKEGLVWERATPVTLSECRKGMTCCCGRPPFVDHKLTVLSSHAAASRPCSTGLKHRQRFMGALVSGEASTARDLFDAGVCNSSVPSALAEAKYSSFCATARDVMRLLCSRNAPISVCCFKSQV